MPPLAFLVEPNTLASLTDRRVFVAEREREMLGFVMLSRVPNRRGWLFEQLPHRPSAAPNGTVELMIDTEMRKLAADGYDYATLTISPISTRNALRDCDCLQRKRAVSFDLRRIAARPDHGNQMAAKENFRLTLTSEVPVSISTART